MPVERIAKTKLPSQRASLARAARQYLLSLRRLSARGCSRIKGQISSAQAKPRKGAILSESGAQNLSHAWGSALRDARPVGACRASRHIKKACCRDPKCYRPRCRRAHSWNVTEAVQPSVAGIEGHASPDFGPLLEILVPLGIRADYHHDFTDRQLHA